MTREEAKAKLMGYLVDYKTLDTSASFSASDLADYVLGAVERIGMVPPEIKVDAIDEKYGLTYSTRANQWEKEDE
jgi:hypothetical protein